MKKRLGLILTTVLTLAMTTTALAAESTTANTTSTTVKAENTTVAVETTGTNVTIAKSASSEVSFKDADGKDIENVTVKISAVTATEQSTAIEKAAAAATSDTASSIKAENVLAAVDVDVTGFTSGTATIPLAVGSDKVTKGEAVYAIHVTSSGIEFLDAKAVADGVVTVTTTSFSPIIIMKGTKPEVKATSSDNKTDDKTTTDNKTDSTAKAAKTGEATSAVVLLAAVSVLGAAVCTKKYAFSK
jgi:hypothetical protein